MQNYPKSDKRIRRCFVPEDGYILVYFDYAQQEYRLLAHYADEVRLIKLIEAGYDVHKATASLVFDKAIEDVTSEDRDRGKQTNFALVYGLGNAAFAKNLGEKIDTDMYKRGQTVLSREGYKPWQMPTLDVVLNRLTDPMEIDDVKYLYEPETFRMINHAKATKAKYFKELPNIKEFIEGTRRDVAAQGFIRLWSGRIKHYNDPQREAYKGVNALIQGGCADAVKKKLPEVRNFLKPYKSRLVNLVHDEFVAEIHTSELFLVPQIKELLNISGFKVTIGCDVKYSTTTWADKREWDDEASTHTA